jgi:hypothetical protein
VVTDLARAPRITLTASRFFGLAKRHGRQHQPAAAAFFTPQKDKDLVAGLLPPTHSHCAYVPFWVNIHR